jgi:CRP-like cAMP-binding protein
LIERAAQGAIREVAPRRDLIREGDKPRGVNLLIDGWACRYKQLPDGRRQIVGFHIPGDLCDSNIFVLGEMDHSLAAVTRLRVAEIDAAEFHEIVRQSSRIARALWWNELVNAAVAREWVANVGQRSAYERIAHLVCEMFVRLRAVGRVADDRCEWPLTQADLAAATGLTAVHVNRTLQELRRKGLLEMQGRQVAIPDLAALQRVASFNPNYLHMNGRADGNATVGYAERSGR